jgi:hypothetical protein
MLDDQPIAHVITPETELIDSQPSGFFLPTSVSLDGGSFALGQGMHDVLVDWTDRTPQARVRLLGAAAVQSSGLARPSWVIQRLAALIVSLS